MNSPVIGVLIGSLASDSVNRKLFHALDQLASGADLSLSEIPISPLPLYNRDLEADLPDAVQAFKSKLESVDGLLILTPEHNRSIPGVLKNALDWSSRPPGQNSFEGQPSAVAGMSPSPLMTSLAQQHLRSILSYFDSPEIGQPEVYLQYEDGFFDDNGGVADAGTREFLLDWLRQVRTHVVTQSA